MGSFGAGRRVFCHEVRINSIRPNRGLVARGLVGEPGVCRPEIVVRRATSQMLTEKVPSYGLLYVVPTAYCGANGRQEHAAHRSGGHDGSSVGAT